MAVTVGRRAGLRPRSPALWFILPACLVLLGVYLGPMLYALKSSFTYWVLTMPGSEDDPAGLSNYTEGAAKPRILVRGACHRHLRPQFGSPAD